MKYVKVIFSSLVLLITFSLIALKTPKVQAAVEKITNVLITNWPELFKTQEQNLDVDGNIKVHEQGTVNVRIANLTPIPVNVNLISTEPRIITVYENEPLSDGLPRESDFIDINGYKKVVLFANKPTANTVTGIYAKFSVDDGVVYSGNVFEIQLDGGNHALYKASDVLGSQIKILIPNAQFPRPDNVSVKLYLIP